MPARLAKIMARLDSARLDKRPARLLANPASSYRSRVKYGVPSPIYYILEYDIDLARFTLMGNQNEGVTIS